MAGGVIPLLFVLACRGWGCFEEGTMKIVLLDAHTANPGDVSWAPLEAIAPCEVHPRTPVAETVAHCADAEVIITNKAPLTREIIAALPKLKYIGVTATGYNVVDTAAAKERGIPVTNVPGYGTAAVAQHVFALLLELTQHTGLHSASARAGEPPGASISRKVAPFLASRALARSQ